MVQQALKLGPNVGHFAERLLDGTFPWAKLRQGQKLLRLADRYTAERLDAARDRPRDTSSPCAEFRRGPMPCAPGTRRRLALPPCSVGA